MGEQNRCGVLSTDARTVLALCTAMQSKAGRSASPRSTYLVDEVEEGEEEEEHEEEPAQEPIHRAARRVQEGGGTRMGGFTASGVSGR